MKLPRVSSGRAQIQSSGGPGEARRWRFRDGRGWAWLIAGVALVLAAFAAWPSFRTLSPPLAVPVPPRPEQLEPQLREYVDKTVAWVRQKPRSEDRQKELGLVYAANGLWPEASLAFSNVARINPRQPLARLYMAAAAQEMGDLPRAAELLRDLAARFPKFKPGLSRLGDVALRIGSVDEAQAAFERLIQLAPVEPRGYAGLGEVQVRKGQHAQAVKSLEKALELDPDAKGVHNLLGLAYRGLGRMEDAKLEMTLGLNPVAYPMPDEWSVLAPAHMRLLQDQFDLANALGQSGQPDKAVAMLEKARVYYPQHLGLLNNLAIAYNRAGRPDQARAVLHKALERNDRYLPAQITLSFSYDALNQYPQALAAAERALELSPQTAQAHLAKANALLGMERDREALAALEDAFRCDPKNGEIQVEIGDVYSRNLQDLQSAFEHYRLATNLSSTLAPAHVRIASYHLRRGDTNAALPVLQILRRVAPGSPDLLVLEDRWRRMLK